MADESLPERIHLPFGLELNLTKGGYVSSHRVDIDFIHTHAEQIAEFLNSEYTYFYTSYPFKPLSTPKPKPGYYLMYGVNYKFGASIGTHIIPSIGPFKSMGELQVFMDRDKFVVDANSQMCIVEVKE